MQLRCVCIVTQQEVQNKEHTSLETTAHWTDFTFNIINNLDLRRIMMLCSLCFNFLAHFQYFSSFCISEENEQFAASECECEQSVGERTLVHHMVLCRKGLFCLKWAYGETQPWKQCQVLGGSAKCGSAWIKPREEESTQEDSEWPIYLFRMFLPPYIQKSSTCFNLHQ